MSARMIFPALMGLVGCAILTALGLWQLDRMVWKEGVLAEIDARIAAEPIALPAVPSKDHDKYLPVSVAGKFTGEFIELLAGQQGTTPGVHVIEVLETLDGRRLMVDRGFVTEEARKTPRLAKELTVTGNLMWPEDATSSTPPPDERTGLWFARDVPAMAAKLRTEETMIVAREPTGDGIEAEPVNSSNVPNNHWGYAIQWFLLSLVWGVMTLYLLWRIRQRTV